MGPDDPRTRYMPRFWLTYCNQSGGLLGVVIQYAYTLLLACLWAAGTEVDQGAQFRQGRKLDKATAALVPAEAIGRMLKPHEAAKLLRKIERRS